MRRFRSLMPHNARSNPPSCQCQWRFLRPLLALLLVPLLPLSSADKPTPCLPSLKEGGLQGNSTGSSSSECGNNTSEYLQPSTTTPTNSTANPYIIPTNGKDPLVLGYDILQQYPHNQAEFTEGLIFRDDTTSAENGRNGTFLESTGLFGQSSLRRVEVGTGRVLQSYALDPRIFGEGIARLDGTLYQLRWHSQRGLIFNLNTFRPRGVFVHPMTDGWGLAALNSTTLIGSDGTSRLYFMKPGLRFKLLRTVTVTDGGVQISNINELEVVNGQIWANIWLTTCIAVIDPTNGRVLAWMDATDLQNISAAQYDDADGPMDVLNGIAWDQQQQRLFVTGKFWPIMFQVQPRFNTTAPSPYSLAAVRAKCKVVQ